MIDLPLDDEAWHVTFCKQPDVEQVPLKVPEYLQKARAVKRQRLGLAQTHPVRLIIWND